MQWDLRTSGGESRERRCKGSPESMCPHVCAVVSLPGSLGTVAVVWIPDGRGRSVAGRGVKTETDYQTVLRHRGRSTSSTSTLDD